ncbi:MAG: hypothetical protein ACM3YM_05190 [Sphingomonadales bacterium]
MCEDDRAYYQRRAEEEIARAQGSTDERLISFHYTLAGFYLDRAFGSGDPPKAAAGSAR